eukprot:COSAG01_NODE_44916_length_414_cov_0.990476_1_plen_81_part_01
MRRKRERETFRPDLALAENYYRTDRLSARLAWQAARGGRVQRLCENRMSRTARTEVCRQLPSVETRLANRNHNRNHARVHP